MLGDVTRMEKAKVVVYTCPFDSMNTETSGVVLIKSAEELKSFSKGEEELIESVGCHGNCCHSNDLLLLLASQSCC